MADETFDAIADARDGTIEVVSAYASNANTRLSSDDLQTLIRDTFATLSSLISSPAAPPADEPQQKQATKAEIRKSIGQEKLVSFEDGREYKSLKRHLKTRGLTPAEYRTRWGLAGDYPMVHPTYSAQRSELAKAIGLGAKGRKSREADATATKTRKPRTTKATTD